MRIFLNGDARDIEPATLDVALGLLGFRDAVVATALNGRFVAKGARPAMATSPAKSTRSAGSQATTSPVVCAGPTCRSSTGRPSA